MIRKISVIEYEIEFQEDISTDIYEENVKQQKALTIAPEVRKKVGQIKNGKAPGPANISNYFGAPAPNKLMKIIAVIFNKCLNEDELPSKEWNRAIIPFIYKKGSRNDFKNYRRIILRCSVASLYGGGLKHRIGKQVNESEDQNDFRTRRSSCIDGGTHD
ncbi:uncharacterized protein [Diabrotica undecimpunctata]|uniref:uncharacterized protein n=1 Tax=Diabrotica undecimpunctata TaxID=50387 RepID=UPI003B6351C8